MARNIAFALLLLGGNLISIHAQQLFQKTTLLMGSRYDLTVVAKDSVEANRYFSVAIQEISRIEKLISSWDPLSETSQVNKNAGIKPVKVSPELFHLIERSIALSKLTDGAFDITYASMDKIWNFDGSMTEMPSVEAIKASVSKVGYRNILLNTKEQTVYLKLPGMKIGFGAIGKGYSADMAKEKLMAMGVKAGIINASGDMNTWGKQPGGKDWLVAITNPFNKSKAFATLPVKNGAVVTSGNYEKFVSFNGVRYAHIINPKTGYPATGVISATIFAPKAELADALATAVFVMGTEVGIDRINQIANVECVMVTNEGELLTSQNIHINEN